MEKALFLDVPPHDERWGHGRTEGTGGVTLHYVRQGEGRPVVLLHGWPGFWYDWRRIIPALAEKADVIAPDFRGYGDSDKPDLSPLEGYSALSLAQDVAVLLDRLGLSDVILVAHDIGAMAAQVLVRLVPGKISALVLLNPPYPGIGERQFEPATQREFWYQHFHQLPLAEELVGYNRDTVHIYLKHFYTHWVGRKEAVRPKEFAEIVAVYARPGAFKSSVAFYRTLGALASQMAVAAASKNASPNPLFGMIAHPTTVLWGEEDPVIRAAWADRLDRFFSQLDQVRLLPGVGHFVPFEAPNEVMEAVERYL